MREGDEGDGLVKEVSAEERVEEQEEMRKKVDS